MKLSEMLDSYLDKTMPLKTVATIEYERGLISAIKKMAESLHLANVKRIGYDDGYRIVKYFKEQTRNKNNSINKYFNYMFRVMKYFEIKSSIYQFPRLPEDTKHFKRFNDHELSVIIRYVRDLRKSVNRIVYQTLVYLLLDSGIRLNEALRIKQSNIDSKRMIIILNETKNHHERCVPFSEFSKDYLDQLKEQGPKREELFWNIDKDRPLKRSDVRQFFKRLSERTNVSGIHAHRFRKTFATKLRQNGARLEAIQYLLGHSRLATTMIYVEQTVDMTIEEYRKFNQWI